MPICHHYCQISRLSTKPQPVWLKTLIVFKADDTFWPKKHAGNADVQSADPQRASQLRRNWYLRSPKLPPDWSPLFMNAASEEAHFSRCGSFARDGNKYWISLHERGWGGVEIWIGVANACQSSWLLGIWRMKCISACVCVCQCVTDAGSAAVEMLFHLSCFPITTLQPEWHRWSECFKRGSNLEDKPSEPRLRPRLLRRGCSCHRARHEPALFAICHSHVFKSGVRAELGPAVFFVFFFWTGSAPCGLLGWLGMTRDPGRSKLSDWGVKKNPKPMVDGACISLDVLWHLGLETCPLAFPPLTRQLLFDFWHLRSDSQWFGKKFLIRKNNSLHPKHKRGPERVPSQFLGKLWYDAMYYNIS